jgi:hypothetical protein
MAVAVQLWTTFFEGGTAYNVWTFVITATGGVLTLIGLGVAIRQILRTRRAAEAAQQAASAASHQIGAISTLVDLRKLCGRINETIILVREKNYRAAALRAGDVRSGIAETRNNTHAASYLTPRRWREIAMNLQSVQEQLEVQAAGRRDEQFSEVRCVHALNDILEQFTSASARALEAAGEP